MRTGAGSGSLAGPPRATRSAGCARSRRSRRLRRRRIDDRESRPARRRRWPGTRHGRARWNARSNSASKRVTSPGALRCQADLGRQVEQDRQVGRRPSVAAAPGRRGVRAGRRRRSPGRPAVESANRAHTTVRRRGRAGPMTSRHELATGGIEEERIGQGVPRRPPAPVRARRTSRIRSPSQVPPGSRVTSTSTPRLASVVAAEPPGWSCRRPRALRS